MWQRHETALAHAIAEDIGAPADDTACTALARFALEAADLVHRHTNPQQAAHTIFALLERGWAADHPTG